MYYLLELQMAKCSLVAHSYMIELLTKKEKKTKKQLHYVYKKPLSDHSPHRLKMEKLPASQRGQISLSGGLTVRFSLVAETVAGWGF